MQTLREGLHQQITFTVSLCITSSVADEIMRSLLRDIEHEIEGAIDEITFKVVDRV